VGEPEGNIPSGMPRPCWEENIEMEYEEVVLGLDWVDLAQDRDTQRGLVHLVMTRRVPKHENF